MLVPFMLAPFMLLVPVLIDAMACMSAEVTGMCRKACSDSGDSSSSDTR